jgi:hypothetical protein
MPLTLTITEGVLPKGQEKAAFSRLSESLLKWTGVTGNKFMTANVVGSIHVLPKEHTFSGLQESPVVFVEWKLPPIAFVDRDVQVGYIAEATQIIHEMSGGRQPKDRIWVNVVHALEGAWGIAGQAMTAAQPEEAISKG